MPTTSFLLPTLIACSQPHPKNLETTPTLDSDVDNDSFTSDVDCNDNDSYIHPGASEIAYDGIDQDCDGFDLLDVDGDGFDADFAGGEDCDDSDPNIHPDAIEMCGDNIDQNCDGHVGDFLTTEFTQPYSQANTRFISDSDIHFGTKIANLGDQDGDGFPEIGIYSRMEDGLGGFGRFFVYSNYTGSEYSTNDAVATLYPNYDNHESARFFNFTNGGDFNGDGLTDLIVGGESGENIDSGGKVSIFFGPLSGSNIDQPDVSYSGDASDYLGNSIESGDVDGDGQIDLLMGSYNVARGKVFLVQGPVEGTDVNIHTAYQSSWYGISSSQNVGKQILAGVDYTGDGMNDLLISAGNYYGSTDEEGAVYLLHGPVVDGDHAIDNSNDAILKGVDVGERAGAKLANAGDLDGDGYQDFLIGADDYPLSSVSDKGKVYVIYGPVQDGERSLNTADATIHGDQEGDFIGISISGDGDVNGDGQNDILISKFSYASAIRYNHLIFGPIYGTQYLSGVSNLSLGGGYNGLLEEYQNNAFLDANQDGWDDILISSPGGDGNTSDYGIAGLFLSDCLE